LILLYPNERNVPVATKTAQPRLRGEAQTSRPVTSLQLALTFVPFGLGLIASMLLAELTQDLRLFRTIYSLRASMLLAVPALALFLFRDRSPTAQNLWRLFWTWCFLAYGVHLGYAWFGVFGNQLETANLHRDYYHLDPSKDPTILDLAVQHLGVAVAYSNFTVTLLWLLDVVLSWITRGAKGLVAFFHTITWLYVLGSFAVSSIVFFKNPTSYALGWSMIVVVAIALVVRLFSRRPESASWSGHTQ
jgi:hypothetical protein